jgi:hypothetical protein
VRSRPDDSGGRGLLDARGIPLDIADVSELQKAEGAVTCCSLVSEAWRRT